MFYDVEVIYSKSSSFNAHPQPRVSQPTSSAFIVGRVRVVMCRLQRIALLPSHFQLLTKQRGKGLRGSPGPSVSPNRPDVEVSCRCLA